MTGKTEFFQYTIFVRQIIGPTGTDSHGVYCFFITRLFDTRISFSCERLEYREASKRLRMLYGAVHIIVLNGVISFLHGLISEAPAVICFIPMAERIQIDASCYA